MIWIIIVAALLLVVLVMLTPRFTPKIYRGQLFNPFPYSDEEYDRSPIRGVEPVDVYLTTRSGVKLHGWYYHLEGASQAILFSHGNKGNVGTWREMADIALRNGMSTFIYDYRGYGLSEGVPTPSGICEDGTTAYDYLIDERGFAPQNIVLFGISMGSGVTCHIATHRRHNCVVLECAYGNFRQLTGEVVPISRVVPKIFFFRQPLDNLALVGSIKTAKLIIHGAKDDLIHVHHAHDLYAAAAEPKSLIILPRGLHCEYGGCEFETYSEELDQFLARNKPA